jgi:hypothetical protein
MVNFILKNRLKSDKKSNNLVFIFVIVMIIVFFINAYVILLKIYEFNDKVSGFASSAGYVNITFERYLDIRMPRDVLNWSSGSISRGEKNATLYTIGDNTGVALRGNWTGENAKAFIVENIGTTNCSIRIHTDKDAHDFFNSSSSTNEEYKINVSNKDSDSCTGSLLGQWIDVNKSSGGTRFCNNFGFTSDNNEIYVDVLLTVPFDGNIGEQSDTITITAEAV